MCELNFLCIRTKCDDEKSHGRYFNEIVLYKKWAIQLIPYTDGMKSGFPAKKGRKN
jgi:hypothetical protein